MNIFFYLLITQHYYRPCKRIARMLGSSMNITEINTKSVNIISIKFLVKRIFLVQYEILMMW